MTTPFDIIDVYSGADLAGAIARSDVEPDTTLFLYTPDISPATAVSLTMPIMRDPFDAMSGLLPIFDMNLPEGALKETLRLAFGKAIPQFDDLNLLSIVGRSQIGKLRFATHGELPREVPSEDIALLLQQQGTHAYFTALLEQYAATSGVSGAQPKVLLRDVATANANASTSDIPRVTHKGATHIVKAFDERRYPELAANEFFCMRAAALAGLPTPRVRLSDDRQILVVDRFDMSADGSYLGFEDFCVLFALRSHGKYDSAYEKLAAQAAMVVSPPHYREAMEQIFLNVALSATLKNGDAHLKNFGVLYEDCISVVRLAPAFDITSTVAYLPHDTLALTLGGSKAFPNRKQLQTFGQQSCGLSVRRVKALLDQVADGVTGSTTEMKRYARKHSDFKPMATLLDRIFQRGLSDSLGVG